MGPFILCLMISTTNALAEEDHHHAGKNFGEGKAITEVSDENGFKLSKESISTLGIKFRKIDSDKFEIDKDTLITSKDFKGVYRFKDHFFKLIPVVIESENSGIYWVHSDQIQQGDKIVVKSAGLLRVADIFSTDKAEYGH